MPLHALILTGKLDSGFVLAPERYDPRRSPPLNGAPLSSLISLKGKTLSTSAMKPSQHYLVLDTGDAGEGFLRPRSKPLIGSEVKSAKKIVQPGDVIISRLRPYLRQVAYVDSGLFDEAKGAEIVVSTE